MRPQLASSPAMAVLTNGELAIARPILRAAATEVAPATVTVTNFDAPSPSRTICWARSTISASRARRKSARCGSSLSLTLACFAVPVAASRKVSLVEVSLSTVMQLKDLSVAARRMSCSTRGGIFASVKAKPSIVAMSGAIMPEPLAKPLIVTVASPILT